LGASNTRGTCHPIAPLSVRSRRQGMADGSPRPSTAVADGWARGPAGMRVLGCGCPSLSTCCSCHPSPRSCSRLSICWALVAADQHGVGSPALRQHRRSWQTRTLSAVPPFRDSRTSSARRPASLGGLGRSSAGTDRVLVKRALHGRATLIPLVQRTLEEAPAYRHDSCTPCGQETHHQLADFVSSAAGVESIA
jgi:hypothetical protein